MNDEIETENVPMIAKRYAGEYLGDATYDPRDNKLRLYAFARLSPADYQRVKAMGFHWAPKQELFVAPSWTPEREDFLLEIAGDIDDESTTPEDRAAFRAERFQGYLKNRERDTARELAKVEELTSGIPLGQPILVGHHSEKRARRDAKRIERGMERAVDQWSRAEYWRGRVPAVLAHAEWREGPGVRARRIKGLAAELRKLGEGQKQAETFRALWTKLRDGVRILKAREDGTEPTPLEEAKWIANHDQGLGYGTWSELDEGKLSPMDAAVRAIERHTKYLEGRSARWAAHYRNRIEFETLALHGEQGTDPDAAPVAYVVGGTVEAPDRRGTMARRRILRITRKGGATVSLSLEGVRAAVAVEACSNYEAPTADETKATRAKVAKPPLCNYPAGSVPCEDRYSNGTTAMAVEEWTSAEWKDTCADYKGTRLVPATATHGAHRVRQGFSKKGGNRYGLVAVFITDQKRTDPPAKAPAPPPTPTPIEEPEEQPTMNEEKDPHDVAMEGLAARMAEQDAKDYEPTEPGTIERLLTDPAPGGLGIPASDLDLSLLRAAEARAEEDYRRRVLGEYPADSTPGPDAIGDCIAALKASLAGGIKAVAAPNLFPTPPAVAREMVRLAKVGPGMHVLEPSAGTGALLDAILAGGAFAVAVCEVNPGLRQALAERSHGEPAIYVVGDDFLGLDPDDDAMPILIDRVLMNPPFDHGSDIEHIRHALRFLRPGGILVGICAGGPRQERELRPLSDYWRGLPPGTFAGTDVRAVLFRITKPVPA